MKSKDEIIKQTKDIIDGWVKYIIRNPTTEVEALHRATICAGCTLLGKNKLGLVSCTVCGCPSSMMTRSKNKECEHPEGNKWLK